MQHDRQSDFRRNEELEDLLEEINGILEPAEDGILKNYVKPRYPVVFIVGCARAGSTLTLQWLANTGRFAYPTNLLSRFYAAPYIGARIQRLLTDSRFNFRDEFSDLVSHVSFTSELGKTRGTLAPNEFWYFWRRFFPYGDIQQLDQDALQKVDAVKFVSELAALESALEKPLVLKAHIINWNIPFVANIFDKVLFIHIVRQPLHNAQSLLESRKKYFGTIDRWYSFKPPEFEKLKECDPYEQVAGQVYFTNEAISRGLDQINDNYWMKVNYEEFCKQPDAVFGTIKEKFNKQDCPVNWEYRGEDTFKSTNQVRLSEEETRRVMNAYTLFAQGAG
jgi:hypothetical protein